MISSVFHDSYRVEVSGWDIAERFFVEKTDLEWGAGKDKRVCLKHSLRARAIIFVRLLQVTLAQPPSPVAYETSALPAEVDGLKRFQLVQLLPVTGEKVKSFTEARALAEAN